MRSTLRTLVLAPVVLAAAAFTASSAMAATINVPFSFIAAGKKCPAGDYTVQKRFDGSVKLAGGAQSFNWLIRPGDPAPTDKRVILRFDAIGSQHALRSIQYGALVTPRLDKKLAQTADAQTESIQGQ